MYFESAVMSALFPNLYTHRKVAETSSKACDICYKPSTSVLITPDKKDFFYVCPIHLKDRYFCTPKIDEDALKAKRERELAEETERLKKEYEEKQKKKKEKQEKAKNGDKDDEKDKKKDGDKEEDKKDAKSVSPKPRASPSPRRIPSSSRKILNVHQPKEGDKTLREEDEPRVFELKRCGIVIPVCRAAN